MKSSLPLALVILYQDYRFAFADLFLKRVLTLVAVLALTVALYRLVIAPHVTIDPPLLATLLGLWVATALAYPWLRRIIYGGVDLSGADVVTARERGVPRQPPAGLVVHKRRGDPVG